MKFYGGFKTFGPLSCSLIVLVSIYNLSGFAEAQDASIQDVLNGAPNSNSVGDSDGARMIRKMIGGLLTAGQEVVNRAGGGTSSNVPGVYDMVKNGTSLGINVLSGLVKVDRVREPGRPRALSVRVFGIPVFNRGFGRGDPMPTDKDQVPGANGVGKGGSGSSDGEEELPLDP